MLSKDKALKQLPKLDTQTGSFSYLQFCLNPIEIKEIDVAIITFYPFDI